jgi:hypothetical protein
MGNTADESLKVDGPHLARTMPRDSDTVCRLSSTSVSPQHTALSKEDGRECTPPALVH